MTKGLCTDFDSPLLNKIAKCLINTLLNLASAAIAALKALIEALLIPLDLAIAALIAQLLQYDILAQQYKLLEAAIKAELDAIQALLNGLPLGFLDPSCTEIVGLNESINDFINNELRPPIDQILYELEQVTSFAKELQLIKEGYEATKAAFLSILTVFDALILEAKCREAAGIQPALFLRHLTGHAVPQRVSNVPHQRRGHLVQHQRPGRYGHGKSQGTSRPR